MTTNADTTLLGAAALAAAGEAVFGPEWRGPMCDHLCVSLRTVQRWASGQNAIPETVWPEVIALLREHAAGGPVRAATVWKEAMAARRLATALSAAYATGERPMGPFCTPG